MTRPLVPGAKRDERTKFERCHAFVQRWEAVTAVLLLLPLITIHKAKSFFMFQKNPFFHRQR